MEQRLIVRVFLVLVLSRGSELVELERFCYYSCFFLYFSMILSRKRLSYFVLGNVETSS